MKRHWMPLYIADYLAGTAHLTTVEHGAYLLLLMHYWIKGEPPESDEIARRVTRMTNRQWAKSATVLRSLFAEGWRHDGLDLELAKVIEKSTSASANARKSHAERKQRADGSQNTNTNNNQNHIEIDVFRRPHSSEMNVSGDLHAVEQIAQAFLTAAGYPDRSKAPPGWYNLPERAALWIKFGYSANMIVEETKIVAAKSSQPKPLPYFEKVFATAFARINQPLPIVQTPPPEKANVRSRQPGRGIQEAIDAQIARAIDWSEDSAGASGSQALPRPVHNGEGG